MCKCWKVYISSIECTFLLKEHPWSKWCCCKILSFLISAGSGIKRKFIWWQSLTLPEYFCTECYYFGGRFKPLVSLQHWWMTFSQKNGLGGQLSSVLKDSICYIMKPFSNLKWEKFPGCWLRLTEAMAGWCKHWVGSLAAWQLGRDAGDLLPTDYSSQLETGDTLSLALWWGNISGEDERYLLSL